MLRPLSGVSCSVVTYLNVTPAALLVLHQPPSIGQGHWPMPVSSYCSRLADTPSTAAKHGRRESHLATGPTLRMQVLEQLPVLLPALMDALNAPTARVAAEALSVLATIASHSHSKHFQPLMKQLLDRCVHSH